MTRSWRLSGYAAALFICAGASAASAQTIVVRSAPPAATAEVVFGTAAGKATVDALGDATVELSGSPASAAEVAVTIYADACGTTVRVVLVGRTDETPNAAPGCQRRAVAGYFVVRGGTSLVVDLAGPVPTVRIRQGRMPAAWLTHGPLSTGRTAPRGIVFHGGAGFMNAGETLLRFCGNALSCIRETTKLSFTGGGAYWLTRWLGVEAGFVKLGTVVADGFGESYEFGTTISPRAVTVAALGGWSVGPARFYGRAGVNYHRAQLKTTQVVYQRTVDIGDTVVTFPEIEQDFVYETVGWGRLLGGGVEGWVSDKAAVFADFSIMEFKGENADDGGVRTFDERPKVFLTGVKIHFGFRR